MIGRGKIVRGAAQRGDASRSFSALVLLPEAAMPDADRLLNVLEQRFAALGTATLAGLDAEEGLLGIGMDGGLVAVALGRERIPYDPLGAEVRPVRVPDPAPVLAAHTAHLRVATRWEAPADAGEARAAAREHAARVTAIAGVLARLGQGSGVFYPSSGVVLPEPEALRAAHSCSIGVSPLDAWVALYPLGHDSEPKDMPQGAYTVGLQPFIGHEIELAPAPLGVRRALDRLYGAAWLALDGDAPLAEGQQLRNAEDEVYARIYAMPSWLRSEVPAFVIVSGDSVVEGRRLRLRAGTDPAVLAHRLPPEPEAEPAETDTSERRDDDAGRD